jgi:acyl carrier protein
MSNFEKYVTAFTSTLLIEESALANLKYQDIAAWDSIGHMSLMTAIEETFGIEMEIDDIIGFSSFEVGRSILAKYNVMIE